jgi:hypothetical protein
MPRFLAAHTAPFTEGQLKELAKSELPEGFTWKVTYCDFADNKFFCDWVAPSKEALEKEFTARNIPFDAVYPMQIFNVSEAKLEA